MVHVDQLWVEKSWGRTPPPRITGVLDPQIPGELTRTATFSWDSAADIYYYVCYI